MLPSGADAVLRVEESTRTGDGRVTGRLRETVEWRRPGEEAELGELLVPAGTPVDPGVLGLAASCGYDTLAVRPRPRAAVRIFGDELLTQGPPGDGRVRDALGPNVPGLLRRYGCAGGARRRGRPGRGHPRRARRRDPVGARRSRPGLHHRRHHARAGRPPAPGAAPRSAPSTWSTPSRSGPASRCWSPGSPATTGGPGSSPGCPATRSRRWSRSPRWSSRCSPGCAGGPLPTARDGHAGRTGARAGATTRTSRSCTSTPPGLGPAGAARRLGDAARAGPAHGFAAIAPGTSGEAGARVPFVPLPLLPGERP